VTNSEINLEKQRRKIVGSHLPSLHEVLVSVPDIFLPSATSSETEKEGKKRGSEDAPVVDTDREAFLQQPTRLLQLGRLLSLFEKVSIGLLRRSTGQ
jgi:hypothetical protein